MSALKEKISSDLKIALKAGDTFRRGVLGMLKSAIQNKEIAKGKKEEGLGDAEIMEVVKTEVKKRMDSAGAFKQAGDVARAQSEESEAVILKKYLPEEASEVEIKTVIDKVITEAGSRSKKDFGRIIGAVMKELGIRGDGVKVKQILDTILE